MSAKTTRNAPTKIKCALVVSPNISVFLVKWTVSFTVG